MIRVPMLVAALALAACTNPDDLDDAPAYLGNFHLGHNVVVAPNLTKGPVSRDASAEEWTAAMTRAIDARFSRYEGRRLYHLGVSVEGYVLARPGVPVVASPKSALIVKVTVWNDAEGRKLNDPPEMVTVVETLSTRTYLGSGLTQSREQQIDNLSRNAAKLIQNWLARQNNEYGWFEDDGLPAKRKLNPLTGRPRGAGPAAAPAPALSADTETGTADAPGAPPRDPSEAAQEAPPPGT